MIKKTLKRILKSVLTIASLVLLYLSSAFVLSRIEVTEEATTKEEIDIYILTNGVHTDLVVPTVSEQINWFEKIEHWESAIDSASYNYLAIGWGDKGFYLNTPSWAELKASTAAKAVVGWSGTAIHATFYVEMPENERCRKIRISNEQYDRLIEFICKGFELGSDGQFSKIETDANKGIRDAFYEGKGRYTLFNTCNSWTNRGLKACGQKACLWTAFQEPIFLKYD